MTEPGDPTVKVAQDLREIEILCRQLIVQAVRRAGHPDMPGGAAMVMLAHVGDPDAYQRRVDEAERAWWDDPDASLDDRPPSYEDEDPDWEPPLQTLLSWSEAWRLERNAPLDGRRPTVKSEAGFLRVSLAWAYDHELHWSDFAADIRQARARIENELYAGIRDERGVPCMYDECRGARLTREVLDDGTRTEWQCSRCRREWDEDRYAQMVTAANESTKFEVIGADTWCSVDYAARTVGRSKKTIRTWISRGELDTACLLAGRRAPFVKLADVRRCDQETGRRRRMAS